MSDIPDLDTVLAQYSKAVDTVHIMGTTILIFILCISWYQSSAYYHKILQVSDKEKRYNVEPHLRVALLTNMGLLCFVAWGITGCQATDIGRYYRDNNLKSWNEVNYNDYPQFNLYLLTITLMVFTMHHTINVIRIFYELYHSMYHGFRFGPMILMIHVLVYFLIAISSEMNPFVMIYSIIIIDYPQHFVIIGIYGNRLCCNKNSNSNSDDASDLKARNRNGWGLMAEIAHCVCLFPHIYVVAILDEDKVTTTIKVLSIAFYYGVGWINVFGWYKVIVNTPKEFVQEKFHSRNINMVELE